MTVGQTYIITLRRRKVKSEVLFNVGNDDETMTLIKLKGKRAEDIFKELILELSRYGGVSVLKSSKSEEVFTIREDLGPIVGGFLILVRRSPRPDKWIHVLSDVLNGKYPALVRAFEYYLTMALDLSRVDRRASGRYSQTLTSPVLDATSSAMKVLVRSLLSKAP